MSAERTAEQSASVLDDATWWLLASVPADEMGQAESVVWAVRQLEAGRDTPTLRILAGLDADDDGEEVDRLCRRALAEMGNPLPHRAEALAWQARRLAEEIARRAPDPSFDLGPSLDMLAHIWVHRDYDPALNDLVGVGDILERGEEWRKEAAEAARDYLAGTAETGR